MKEKVDKLRHELKELKEKFMADEISADDYKDTERRILKEIEETEEDIKKYEEEQTRKHEEEHEARRDKEEDKKDIHDKEHKHHHAKHDSSIWMAVSIAFMILVIISVLTGGFNVLGGSQNVVAKNVISAQEASAKATNYINAMLQGQGSAKVLDIKDIGSLYSLKLDIGGQIYDSYMTKDGELLFPTSFDLSKPLAVVENPSSTVKTDTIKTEVSIDDDPSIGPKDAKVTIIEFSDFQCPYCARAEPAVKEIIKTYGDKVRFVYRDFPLSFHQNAQKAAEAAECADEQGKFWEYHDKLYENQGSLDGASLKKYAKDLGMDETTFNKCVDDRKFKTEVEKDFNDGQLAGVSGTPAFFINGQLLSGAQPFSEFKKIIDAELAR